MNVSQFLFNPILALLNCAQTLDSASVLDKTDVVSRTLSARSSSESYLEARPPALAILSSLNLSETDVEGLSRVRKRPTVLGIGIGVVTDAIEFPSEVCCLGSPLGRRRNRARLKRVEKNNL